MRSTSGPRSLTLTWWVAYRSRSSPVCRATSLSRFRSAGTTEHIGREAMFTVRSANTRDLERVIDLLRAADLPVDGLSDQFGDGYAVAEENGLLIGAAGIEKHGNVGLLRSVVVSAAERGRGVGEALVADRMNWASRGGLTALYLLTVTAIDYFPRFGFAVADRSNVPEEVKASTEFSSACPSTATVMWSALGNARHSVFS